MSKITASDIDMFDKDLERLIVWAEFISESYDITYSTEMEHTIKRLGYFVGKLLYLAKLEHKNE